MTRLFAYGFWALVGFLAGGITKIKVDEAKAREGAEEVKSP